MRPDDLRQLQVTFPSNDLRGPDEQLRDALQLGIPAVRALLTAMLTDLSTEHFGIGWWRQHVPSRRRILISDQMYLSTWSIETNMKEARLHHLEALGHLDEHGRAPPLAVYRERDGRVRPEMLRLPDAASHLPGELGGLHVVGFFRALGSAFDCLGAATVAVAALPKRILRADLRDARHALRDSDAQTPGGVEQRRLHERFEQVIAGAGPEGWLEWTLNFRNMLVHRGRHLQQWTCIPTGQHERLVDGRVRFGVEGQLHLPRDPSRGEVDAWRDDAQHFTLDEDARETLNGVWKSAQVIIDGAAALLLELWNRRRADPALLVQPEQQWPSINVPGPVRFRGYRPEPDESGEGSQAMTAGSFAHRMQAAGLDGDRHARWAELD